jgi:hypothetical protein
LTQADQQGDPREGPPLVGPAVVGRATRQFGTQPLHLRLGQSAGRPTRTLRGQCRILTGTPPSPPLVGRLRGHPQPTSYLYRSDSLLEQPGGLKPHPFALDPSTEGQAATIIPVTGACSVAQLEQVAGRSPAAGQARRPPGARWTPAGPTR